MSWEKCPNPNCTATNVRRLIACNEGRSDGYLGCDNCGQPRKKFTNCNLGQVVDKWENTSTGKTMRLTTGKAWEISNRVMGEDGKTVINKVTGKETQY